MLDILTNLSKSNGFVVYDFVTDFEGVNAALAVPGDNHDHQEYYTILECLSVDESFVEKLLEAHSEKLMDDLEAMDYTDESFRKNSTLILCCEEGFIPEKDLLKLEENPYFFKKNAITYTKSELESLRGSINNELNNDDINELLMSNNGESFELFKNEKYHEGHYYPLLIRIITKLPFVHFIPKNNNLDSLDVFVKSDLEDADLVLLEKICTASGELNEEYINALFPQIEAKK